MFLFQLFQFLSLVERLLDRKTGRIDGAWAFRESLADSERRRRRRRRSDQVVGGGEQKTRVGKHVSGQKHIWLGDA
jgi:hypothetical protein